MMDATMQKIRAVELWREGYNHHTRAFALAGGKCDREAVDELNAAVSLYSQSIETFPTAEAYTFRGWAYRSFGRIDDAIEECKRAIQVDPDFGNPYNDIGAYMMSKGDLDEAVEWLEKAKRARKYEPRHYPFMNLGRLYAQKGMVLKAISEYEAALGHAQRESGDANAVASISADLRKLRAMLN
jgi:tetratricopeptide (TPR) repeat protein